MTRLPVPVTQPADARHIVRTALAGAATEAETAELLASELVTNALVHGSGHATLAVTLGGKGLLVEVTISTRRSTSSHGISIRRVLVAGG